MFDVNFRVRNIKNNNLLSLISLKKKYLVLKLFFKLINEVGLNKSCLLITISSLINFLDIASIGLLIGFLFNTSSNILLSFQDLTESNLFLIILFTIVFLRCFLKSLLKIFQQKIKSEYLDSLREELLYQIVYSPIERIYKLSRGDIIGLLLVDINRTIYALDSGLRTLQQIIALLVYLFFLIIISKFISLALIAGLISCLVAISFQKANSWELGKIQSLLNSSLQKIVGDGLFGLKAVKSSAKEDWILKKFEKENSKLRTLLLTILRKQSIFNSIRETAFIALVIIFILIFSLNIDKAELSTLLILGYKFSTILSRIIDLERSCMNSLPGYRRLVKIRKSLSKFDFAPSRIDKNKITKIDDSNLIEFSWSSSNALLKNCSFNNINLEIGKLNIITGKSGFGKTTLLDIAYGMISPENSYWKLKTNANTFKLNGLSGARSLRHLISYSPQVDFIFESSLYENILLKENNLITLEEKNSVKYFLTKLGLEYLSNKQQNKEFHNINNLYSPGEIKRICILRNLLIDKPIEFYDEPTTFLDKESKIKLIDFLKNRSRNKIILLVSHDKDLISQSDNTFNLLESDRINLIDLYK